MHRKGFTLPEIMIVTTVIGLLATLAIPNFLKSREASRRSVCVANLKQIKDAMQIYAVGNNKSGNDTVTMDDLVPDYIRKRPVCPKGGTYTLTTIEEEPTCSLSGPPSNHHL